MLYDRHRSIKKGKNLFKCNLTILVFLNTVKGQTVIALVVEDERTLEVIYRFILERAGFKVLFATDGQQALDILETTTPNLIFLDMLLPHVHGREVLRYIRKTNRLDSARVVVTSSMQNYERDVEREEFLLKPVHAPVIARIADETRSQSAGHC